MGYIGKIPSAVPLTSADITDNVITSAKIVDSTIVNADIANSTINLTQKVTGALPVANGGTGLTALGTANQELRVNSGATALEYYTPTVASSDYVLLATTTASGSATSISFDGYFSSTYDNYMLIGYDNYSSATSGNHTTRLRFRKSNADITTSNYHRCTYGRRVFSSGDDVGGSTGTWNGDSAEFNPNTQTESNGGAYVTNFIVNIFNPLSTTNYKYAHFHFNSFSAINQQLHANSGGIVLKDNTNALSGVTIFMQSGNIYGKFKLYGIK